MSISTDATRASKSFDLEIYFRDCQKIVHTALESFLPKKETFPSKIHEAMHYSLFAGGKRIRPVLCMAASEACGGGRREVIPIACALEMIHTFSLIHDDLPAMDDDNLRRGVPTNHKVFGEAVAILAGDGLVSEAFGILGKSGLSMGRDAHHMLEVIHDIAVATGSLGMVGGQVLDIEAEGKTLDIESLKKLHALKTGKLIAVSVTSGAKIATDAAEKIAAIEVYGRAVGLAFQIADDILDVEGGEEIGKDIGSDAENNKSTYATLLGLEGAKLEAQKCIKEALNALHRFGEEADALRAIAQYIIERKK